MNIFGMIVLIFPSKKNRKSSICFQLKINIFQCKSAHACAKWHVASAAIAKQSRQQIYGKKTSTSLAMKIVVMTTTIFAAAAAAYKDTFYYYFVLVAP